MENAIAKQGSLLRYDIGQFSDYNVIGFFVVLDSFNPAEFLETYLSEHPKQRESSWFDANMFLAALIKSGLLLEVEHGVLHAGSYSSVEDFRFEPQWEYEEGVWP